MVTLSFHRPYFHPFSNTNSSFQEFHSLYSTINVISIYLCMYVCILNDHSFELFEQLKLFSTCHRGNMFNVYNTCSFKVFHWIVHFFNKCFPVDRMQMGECVWIIANYRLFNCREFFHFTFMHCVSYYFTLFPPSKLHHCNVVEYIGRQPPPLPHLSLVNICCRNFLVFFLFLSSPIRT